jgi:hypothetical protein
MIEHRMEYHAIPLERTAAMRRNHVVAGGANSAAGRLDFLVAELLRRRRVARLVDLGPWHRPRLTRSRRW